MYSIYYGNTPVVADMQCLWAPGLSDESYLCYGLKLSLEAGAAGTLTFTLPPSNSAYTELKSLITLIEVRDTLAVNTDSSSVDYNPDGVVWDGRVLSIERDFYNQKTVTVEGALAFLYDSIQLWTSDFMRSSPGTFVKAVLEGYTSKYDGKEHGHNDMCPLRKIHYSYANGTGIQTYIDPGLGINTVTISDIDLDSYSNSLGLLSSAFSVYDGFFFIHYRGCDTDGYRLRYLGFTLTENAEESDQPISFGENLLDLSESIDASEVVNRVQPFGALLDDEIENPTIFDRWQLNTVLSSGDVSKQAAADAVRLASSGLISGSSNYYYSNVVDPDNGLYDWWIARSNADSDYDVPPVWEVVVFDDIGAYTETTDSDGNTTKTRDTPTEIRKKLVQAAVDYLESKIQKELVITVKAVDLRDAGYDCSRMWIGKKYPITSYPHGYSQKMILTKCTISIQSPESNTYTLGYTGATMSDDVFHTSKDLTSLTQEVQLMKSSNGSALAQAKAAQKTADAAAKAVSNISLWTYSEDVQGTKLFTFSVDGGINTSTVNSPLGNISNKGTTSIDASKVSYRTVTINGTDYNILTAE